MVINNGNIEEYLLLLVDGELEAAAETEVLAYIERHPEYQPLLEAFLQTRLEDETIVFEDKESLLKPEPKVAALPVRRKQAMAVAAALLLLAGLGSVFMVLMKQQQPPANMPAVATIGHKQNPVTGSSPASASSPQAVIKPPGTISPAVQAPATALMPAKRTNRTTAQIPAMVAARRRVEAPEALPVAGYSIAVPDVALPAVAMNMEQSLPAGVPQPSKEINNWSIINPDKFEVIDALIAQAETLKAEVQEKAKALRVNTVAIRLGGREFTIIK